MGAEEGVIEKVVEKAEGVVEKSVENAEGADEAKGLRMEA